MVYLHHLLDIQKTASPEKLELVLDTKDVRSEEGTIFFDHYWGCSAKEMPLLCDESGEFWLAKPYARDFFFSYCGSELCNLLGSLSPEVRLAELSELSSRGKGSIYVLSRFVAGAEIVPPSRVPQEVLMPRMLCAHYPPKHREKLEFVYVDLNAANFIWDREMKVYQVDLVAGPVLYLETAAKNWRGKFGLTASPSNSVVALQLGLLKGLDYAMRIEEKSGEELSKTPSSLRKVLAEERKSTLEDFLWNIHNLGRIAERMAGLEK